MSGFELTAADEKKLIGVHPELVAVVRQLANQTAVPFMVVEGLRTAKRQAQLVAAGASRTLNSRHLTGHAVDLVPMIGKTVSWAWPHFYPLAREVKRAAIICHVPIEWGGDWWRFKDGPHWQLPWGPYPAKGK